MCTFRSFWELWGIFCHKCSSWDASFDKLSPNFPPEVLSSECMKSVLCFLSFRQPPSVQGVSGVWSPIINTTVTSCWARLQPLAFKCLHGRMTAAGIIKSLRVIGALKGLPGFPLSARFFQSDQGGQNVLILAECMDFSVKMGNRWKKRKSFGVIFFFFCLLNYFPTDSAKIWEVLSQAAPANVGTEGYLGFWGLFIVCQHQELDLETFHWCEPKQSQSRLLGCYISWFCHRCLFINH